MIDPSSNLPKRPIFKLLRHYHEYFPMNKTNNFHEGQTSPLPEQFNRTLNTNFVQS